MKDKNYFLLLFLILFYFSGLTIYSMEPLPKKLEQVGVSENLGQRLPLDLVFKDSYNNTVTSNILFESDKPTILNLAYYSCPMLCHLVTGALVDGINNLSLELGVDYNILTISIDPKDSVTTAAQFRDMYHTKLTNFENKDSWKFLVGNESDISKLSQALGFNYTYDKKSGEFSHSAVLFVLSSKSEIVRYLYGLQFRSLDLKISLLESKNDSTISTVERLLLFCYNYNPQSTKYVLFAKNLMKIAGLLTVFTIVLMWFILSKKR